MKIVVLQPLGLGDVVLSLSMVQTLKRALPDARITMVVRASVTDIPESHPDIDSVIRYDVSVSAIMRYFRLVAKLTAGEFDVSIVCPGSLIVAAAPSGAGIAQRIGSDHTLGVDLFDHEIRYRRLKYQTGGALTAEILDGISRSLHVPSVASHFFTDVVQFDPERHAIDRYCSLLGPLNIAGSAERPAIPPPAGDSEELSTNEAVGGIKWDPPPMAVVPGSIWLTKRWGGERYLSLVTQLRKKYPEREILLCGSRDESELCDSIEASADDRSIRDISGKISLRLLAEVFRRCAVVISNDSGTGHLAAAVGTPTVTIFGPTVPRFGFVPAGKTSRVVEGGTLSCRPCGPYGGTYCPVKTHECMNSISVASVMSAIESIVG